MLSAVTEAAAPPEAAHRALATLAATLAGSYLVLYELDEEKQILRPMAQVAIPPGHSSVLNDQPVDSRTSLIGRVMQTGRAHHLANLSRSFFPAERNLPRGEKLSALGLPVKGRGGPVGVLFVCGPRDILGEGELKLISGLADALGCLLERARADAALTHDRMALQSLMEHLPDAVIEQASNGKISAGGGRVRSVLGRPLVV